MWSAWVLQGCQHAQAPLSPGLARLFYNRELGSWGRLLVLAVYHGNKPVLIHRPQKTLDCHIVLLSQSALPL